jgi:ankyrin repeat protein
MKMDGRRSTRAALNGHDATVRLLLERGAEVSSKTKDGWTALSITALNGYDTTVRFLLERKAEVDAKDEDR